MAFFLTYLPGMYEEHRFHCTECIFTSQINLKCLFPFFLFQFIYLSSTSFLFFLVPLRTTWMTRVGAETLQALCGPSRSYSSVTESLGDPWVIQAQGVCLQSPHPQPLGAPDPQPPVNCHEPLWPPGYRMPTPWGGAHVTPCCVRLSQPLTWHPSAIRWAQLFFF